MFTMSIVEVVNPFDEEIIGSIASVDSDTVDGYLETAHNLFRDRKNWMPAYKRIEILKKAAKLWEGDLKNSPFKSPMKAESL